MNYRFWSSLIAGLLTTAFGATSPSHAETAQAVNFSRVTPSAKSVLSKRGVGKIVVQQPEVFQVAQDRPQQATEDNQAIAKILAHSLDGQQAATLYVRNIPVLTFLSQSIDPSGRIKRGETGDGGRSVSRARRNAEKPWKGVLQPKEMEQLPGALDSNKPEEDPVRRGEAVAARINELSRKKVDAETINVSWKSGRTYAIAVAGEELVQIDAKTILADTTHNEARDALQATNRLRRLIGNALPLRAIARKPADRPNARFVDKPVVSAVDRFILPTQPRFVERVRYQLRGLASWYGPGFDGNRSASGEIYRQNRMTAAHRSLPFGTKVRVTNLKNGRSVVVRINDRGPFIRGRVIDLSVAAAKALGFMKSGVAPVRIDVLGKQQVVSVDEN